MKTKTRTHGDKVYNNFHDLNVPEDDIEWESFLAISIIFLPVFKNKYYLVVHLGDSVFNIVDK